MIDLGKSEIRLIACRRDKGNNDDGKFTGVYEARNNGASSFLVFKYAWTKHGTLQESLFASNPAFIPDPDGESPCLALNPAEKDTGPHPADLTEYAACTHQVWGDR
jgi:hypothetical protein